MYNCGLGVEQSFKEAMKWYLLAANQNHPGAQYNIGSLYQNGLGVEQDFEEAMKWYLKVYKNYNVDLTLKHHTKEGIEFILSKLKEITNHHFEN
jgi:hypothetical protein